MEVIAAIIAMIVIFLVCGLVSSFGKGKVMIIALVCCALGIIFPPLEIIGIPALAVALITGIFFKSDD